MLRINSRFVIGLTGLAALAACGRSKPNMSDELKNDLSLASSDQGLSLASSVGAGKGSQVISAVERSKLAPPAPRSSERAVSYKRSPRPTPEKAPVVAATPEPTPEVTTPQVTLSQPPAEEGPPAPRPEPVTVLPSNTPASNSGSTPDVQPDRGSTLGAILGTILTGVIIRGGVGDGDNCDPHGTAARRRPPISVNRRMPTPISGGRW